MLRSVNMILPEELYDIIWDKIEDERKNARYAKVIMKLQDLLEGAFFTEYIKKGDLLPQQSAYRVLVVVDSRTEICRGCSHDL